MSEDYDYNYRAPAIICAILAGGLFGFFIVTSIIWWDEGANIGGGIAVFVGIFFAALAGHYWTKPPPGPPR
jgi:UDP-N-acetylmuramyl pentapeptide phosphotransferase/UDP-N-acetylglucosamine-1-phosphate transferase